MHRTVPLISRIAEYCSVATRIGQGCVRVTLDCVGRMWPLKFCACAIFCDLRVTSSEVIRIPTNISATTCFPQRLLYRIKCATRCPTLLRKSEVMWRLISHVEYCCGYLIGCGDWDVALPTHCMQVPVLGRVKGCLAGHNAWLPVANWKDIFSKSTSFNRKDSKSAASWSIFVTKKYILNNGRDRFQRPSLMTSKLLVTVSNNAL